MVTLLHSLIEQNLSEFSEHTALVDTQGEHLSYAGLYHAVQQCAAGLLALGLQPLDRVAVYLPKCSEAVTSLFACSLAGGIVVPVNAVLKAKQVQHILQDCNVRYLITSMERAEQLTEVLSECPDLEHIIISNAVKPKRIEKTLHQFNELLTVPAVGLQSTSRETGPATIFYTSGSTGKPKGVVVSHQNIVCGAESVASYLHNHSEDRLLAVLPFSFDYGFSQLTTSFCVGGSCYLMEYLFAKEIPSCVAEQQITGLAAVPPIWVQLARMPWPRAAVDCLRYITNSGGRIPRVALQGLQQQLPQTKIFLMYGLTEAFRSTYLPPDKVQSHPESIGKAIPNAEVLVLRKDGSVCDVHEPGELVHRGPLVAMGYWNDEHKTKQRFKPLPKELANSDEEIAVWSGDTVKYDENGYLYYIGRDDGMIKTSGYRVSPEEVEEELYAYDGVLEVVALGVPDAELGQAVCVVIVLDKPSTFDIAKLQRHCQQQLPGFMVPKQIIIRDELPRNPNGKIDRQALHHSVHTLLMEKGHE